VRHGGVAAGANPAVSTTLTPPMRVALRRTTAAAIALSTHPLKRATLGSPRARPLQDSGLSRCGASVGRRLLPSHGRRLIIC
jgi:hypothetical protein